MKKILVTGGTGFIGSNCLNLLSQLPHEIFATYRSADDMFNHDRIRWIRMDLTRHDDMQHLMKDLQPSHLMHAAWSVPAGMQLNSIVHHDWLGISKQLLRSFRENGGKRALMLGTCAEYGVTKEVCVEGKTPLRPDTDYGRSKRDLYEWLKDYSQQWSLSYAWARPFFLYGPGERENRFVPYLIRSMLEGDTVKTTYARQIHDYLYIEDAARALSKLLFSKFQGAINICSGAPVQLSHIIENIAHLIPGDHKIIFGAIASSPNDYQFLVGDEAKLRKSLRFSPKIDLVVGLQKYIQSMKKTVEV